MHKIFLFLLAALIFVTFSPTPAFAAAPFTFYCSPNIHSYIEGGHYMPTGSPYATCYLVLPEGTFLYDASGGQVYRGTPGGGGDAVAGYYGGRTGNNTYIYRLDFGEYEVINEGTPQETSVRHEPKEGSDFYTSIFIRGVEQTLQWKWGAKPASEFDPVIIIPGILGSWEKDGKWVLDPISHVYDNLINTFLANGYVEGETLFTLPYDWRKSNVETAQLLAQKVEQIKTICSCQYVDIIAHSMGGLVATQYIMNKQGANDVDQLFLLGTPLFGAPKAYKAWEAGEMDFGDSRINAFLTRTFSKEATDNGYSSIFDYIHQKPIPSIQELLPYNQNYLKRGSAILSYPTGYPENTFLKSLLGDVDAFLARVYYQVHTYIVTGDMGLASTTVGFVIKDSTQLPKWKDGEVVSPILGAGDGTIPLDSATYFSGPDKSYPGITHTRIASSSSPYVFETLNYKPATTIVGKEYSIGDADIPLVLKKIAPSPAEFNIFTQTIKEVFFDNPVLHSLLFIVLFSPIDVQVTAPDGKKLGKDLAAGSNLQEIPNSKYSGPLDEYEYVMVVDPLPGQYKVETVGTGNGVYTIASGLISDATTSISLVSGTTTLNQVISNTLFLSSTSTSVTITPPATPIATSTPTTTTITPDTCVTDITAAYKAKWIGKKLIYDKLVFDCRALKELFKARDTVEKIAANKRKAGEKLLLAATYAGIRLTLADMDLLAKDKTNTKDAVLLITKITTWFRNHELK